MAMEIGSNYTHAAYSGKKTAENTAAQKTAESDNAPRKTAAGELAYLSKKYDGYSFIGANYTYGMQYGSKSTTNVAISPQFLAKMANDPELEKEYESYIADMPRLDEQFDRSVEAGGWHVVAKGWFIDKDGGIGGWCITQKDDAKSYLETLSENAEKIQKQKEEAKQEKAELEAQREADRKAQKMLQKKIEEAGKEQFGDQFKGALVIAKNDEKDTDSEGILKKLLAGQETDALLKKLPLLKKTQFEKKPELESNAEKIDRIRKEKADRMEKQLKEADSVKDPMEKFRIMAQKIASGEFQIPQKDGGDGLNTKA